MKELIFLLSFCFLSISCAESINEEPDENDDNNDDIEVKIDYRQEMRDYVIDLSKYAKEAIPGFIIVPQNGIELVTIREGGKRVPHTEYLNAIDACGQEDLYFGYNADDKASPKGEINFILPFLHIAKDAGKVILTTDYCSTQANVESSYDQNDEQGFIAFAAHRRALDAIPTFPDPIHNENNNSISKISEIKNFLYLINPGRFSSKRSFIDAVIATNYDLLIMDLFFGKQTFSADEIEELRAKANGGKRLVICYLSVGGAEIWRYYWQSSWKTNPPDWLAEEDPDWPGDYKVKYWDKEWQKIIYGNDDSYLKKILDANFDGAYLDIIDGYEYFEYGF